MLNIKLHLNIEFLIYSNILILCIYSLFYHYHYFLICKSFVEYYIEEKDKALYSLCLRVATILIYIFHSLLSF